MIREILEAIADISLSEFLATLAELIGVAVIVACLAVIAIAAAPVPTDSQLHRHSSGI